jgi:hypothetical protein
MAKALQVKPKCSNLQEPSQTPTTNLPSMNGVPPLLETPNGVPSSLPVPVAGVEPSCTE